MSSPENLEWINNLEVVKNYYNKDGSLLFIAEALSKEFVPVDVMKEFAHTFEGKELRWRHLMPELDVNAGIGHIHKAWVDNEKLNILAEVWNYKERPELAQIHQDIKDGKLSISCGFKATKNKNNEIVAIYGRELSLTPNPACTPEKGCGITSYIQLENKGETNLPNDDEKIINFMKETVAKLESSQGEQIRTLESLVKSKDKEIQIYKATIESLENRNADNLDIISKQTETLKQHEETIKDLKVRTQGADTIFLRQEIVKLEGLSDPEAIQSEMEDLATLSKEQLENIKAKFERVLQFGKKTDPNRQTPQFGGNEGQTQLQSNGQQPNTDNMTPEEFATYLDQQKNGGNFDNYMRSIAQSRNQQVGPYGMTNQGVGNKQVPML